MRRTLALFAAVCLTTLAACEKTVTLDSYNQIKVGMSYEEVKSIMGGDGQDETPSGTSISGSGVASGSGSAEKLYVWKDGEKRITVNIKDGKVTNMTKFGL